MRLSTLLGRDEYPGELAGWGPVHAGLARDLATTMGRGQWRFAITDEQGHLPALRHHSRPPHRSASPLSGLRGDRGTTDPATTLRELNTDSDALGTWAPVITDLARQHTTAQRPPHRRPHPTHSWRRVRSVCRDP
ncbi:MAG: hypothetical protein ACRDRU_17695 [Pseudonocardiaceae bacterium]